MLKFPLLQQLKSLVFVIGLIGLCSAPLLQADEADNTLLWRISGNELSATSYLYGTFHVQDERVFRFNDSVAAAFYACDALATEVHFDSVSTQLIDYIFNNDIDPGLLLDEALPKLDADKLVEALTELTDMEPYEVRASPLRSLMYRLQMGVLEEDKPVVVDTYFYSQARQAGMQYYGLESLEEQLKYLMQPATKQDWRDMLDDIHIYEEMEAATDQMIAYYREGNLDGLMDFVLGIQTAQEMEEEYGLVARNYIMVERAQPLMRKHSVFIAVGALHLPGQEGVISLLRKEGFTVEPVVAGYAGQSRQFAELELDQDWIVHVDSLKGLRVNLPSEPVKGPELEEARDLPFEIDMDISVDLIQQRSFLIISMDMSGIINPAEMTEEGLDDLYRGMVNGMGKRFSEASGGEELEIENTMISGKRAVRAQVRSSETSEIRAVLNEATLIMFIASSQSEDVDFSTFEPFFNSIELFDPEYAEIDEAEAEDGVTQLEGLYKVQPAGTYVFATVRSAAAPREMPLESVGSYFVAKSPSGATTYMFIHVDPGPNSYYLDDKQILTDMVQNALGNIGAQPIKQRYESDAFGSKLTARFTQADGTPGEMHVAVHGSYAVGMMATGKGLESERADVDAFFESLTFEEAEEYEWERKANATFGYSVELPGEIYELESSDATVSLAMMYSSGLIGVAPDTRADFMATVIEMGPYAQQLSDTSEAWFYIQRSMSELGDTALSITPITIDGFEGYEVYSQSSTSSLGMRARVFTRGQNILSFFIRQFPGELRSAAANRFFNSIKIDAYAGPVLADSKTKILLDDALSGVAVRADPAIESLPYFSFAQDDLDLLFGAMRGAATNPNRYTAEVLPLLMEEVLFFSTDETSNKIAESYADFKDFPETQAAALSVLLRDPSALADQVLTKLLQGDLSSIKQHATRVFSPAHFYNRDVFKADWVILQTVMPHPEFRMAMYPWLSSGIEQGAIVAGDYEELMVYALKDAGLISAAMPARTSEAVEKGHFQALVGLLHAAKENNAQNYAEIAGVLCSGRQATAAFAAVHMAGMYDDLEFDDDCLNTIGANLEFRLKVLKSMDADELQQVPEKWRTQPMIAESFLINGLQTNYSLFDVAKLKFVESFDVKYGVHAGRYYIYTFDVSQGTRYKPGTYAGMAGPQPLDESQIELQEGLGVSLFEEWQSATAREHFDAMFEHYLEE